MEKIVVIGGDLSLKKVTDGDCALISVVDGEYGNLTQIESDPHETYSGETHITPSAHEQVLETANKVLESNIIVDPIPKNYGRITWNGAFMLID